MEPIETNSFAFEIWSGWDYFRDENERFVAHGPTNEELIVSVTTVKNEKGEIGDEYLTQVFANARNAIERVLADPDLRVTSPPRFRGDLNVSCFLAEARSADGEIAFTQMAFRGVSAVMFATLETAATGEHLRLCSEFMESVRDRAAGTAV